ncbi:RNA helicase Mov10l1-like isoform X2 [Hyposmocoma kahamanoa]|uniref:RNA helicase Mov10l1-like isoform X2 n=1 Tax=Hyposmocoma kahamanoa TaxID=1477025 RepID=UPI000E6D8269|nr:RNA helicase Mov10l1-like isoform X2 [Hyposmocoma kahamanoa]
MRCELCADPNVGPGHEISEKHIRNKVLYDYSFNRKQFAGNRKEILVLCSVQTSFTTLVDSADPNIKISARPKEDITFNFKIKNDSKAEDIMVVFIQMAHTKLNFKMNDHGLQFGCKPLIIKPKATLQREIKISFACGDVGQYEMPIIFSFRKPASKESVVIIRDMVVYVEEQLTTHEILISPYTRKQVCADKLLKTTVNDRGDDMFRIPKNYKSIYANNLKVKEGEDVSQEQRNLCNEIKEIFETGVTKENYIRFFHNLLWYEETIARINLKKYNMSGVPLLAKGDYYALVVPGLGEKRPSLMLGDLVFLKPQDNEELMFEAIVTDMAAENIVYVSGLHPDFKKFYRIDGLFDVRFIMSRMPLERMHQAVNSVVKESVDVKRVFPHANKNIVQVKPIKYYYNPKIETNAEQRLAVERIVSGTSGTAPFLVHGPPGTGKTVTIVEAILQLVNKNANNRIMVCTDSNMAADHVGTELIKYTHMLTHLPKGQMLLRANSKFRVWETLPESLMSYSNGYNYDTFTRLTIQIFKTYKIVITTLSHAAKFAKELRIKRLKRPITHLFIDEAAQASEPACLIPICGLLSPNGALVLAGDPLQLGPVIISHNARRLGLGLSLMERLKTNCELYSAERNDDNYMVMLKNNFRSHADILHIPSELFYMKQLRVLANEDPLSRTDILCERAQSRAIVFHGVLSKEQRMGKSPSYFNDMESKIVQVYIELLIKQHKVLPEDIGVVTPYIRQVYKIKKWLESQHFGPGRIEVGTVEAFQGKEKRVIIISTVRANCGLLDHDAKFQLGFLVDDKRFNVALTRAKAKAIVIGNPLCLERDVKWRTYINKCREFGTYFGFDSQLHQADEIQKDIVEKITPILKNLKLNKAKA